MEFESEGKRKKERKKDSQSVGRQQAESERDISDERCSYGITDGGGGMKTRQRDWCCSYKGEEGLRWKSIEEEGEERQTIDIREEMTHMNGGE